jgi:hypothetical protein
MALRYRKAQMSSVIRQILRVAQQFLPLAARQAAFVEIGSRPLATMIEKALIVVTLFQRLDLVRDEAVKRREIDREVIRQGKIQALYSLKAAIASGLQIKVGYVMIVKQTNKDCRSHAFIG